MTDVTFLTAFVAGVFSISSPCVLPLIPIYLTHIAGVSAGQSGPRARAIVLRNAAAYVMGFSLVFIALGAALGTAGVFAGSLDFKTQNRLWLVRIGGVLLVLLGLHQIGWISHFLRRMVPLRRSDPRRHPDHGRRPGQHRRGNLAADCLLARPGRAVHAGRARLRHRPGRHP
jgi:cytochrome c biogenesis protein CcdA